MQANQIPPIRIVLNDTCDLNCSFCHKEGKYSFPNTDVDADIVLSYLDKVKRKGTPIEEVHLTGGEPTLHPQFETLINILLSKGYKVKVTTNGNFSSQIRKFLIDSNIDGINFSIHTINPEKLQTFQEGKNLKECELIINNQLENIRELKKEKNKIKINSIILDKRTAEEMLDFAINENIPLRFMPDLNRYEETYRITKQILQENDFAASEKLNKSSNFSGVVKYYKNKNGYLLGIKEIRKVYNESLCYSCEFRNTKKCREGFYGIRIFRDGLTGEHKIRLCLDKNDKKTIIPLENFDICNLINR